MHRCGPGASSSQVYSHNELHQRFVDSSSVTSIGSSASRYSSYPLERVGVTAKRHKECAFSTTEDHFSWRGMGLNVDAGVPVGCGKYKARPVTHCQTVSETFRSYGSSIQRDTFWTVVHETPAVGAQDQRVFPFRMIKVTLRCLRALVMWKKPWFLFQGPVLGASCRRKMLTTDASLMGWGAILEERSRQGLWKDHHLSWHINRLEMLAVFIALKNFLADLRGHHVLVHSDNTYGGLLHKSPGGSAVTSTLQISVPNPPVVPRKVVVYLSSLHPGGPQHRSRHPVETGAEARGMEAPPRCGGADMKEVRPGTSVSVCISRDVSLSIWFSLTHPATLGMDSDSADVAKASSVCISLDRSAPGSPGESSPGPGSTTSHYLAVTGQSMVPRYNIPFRWASNGAPNQEGPSVPSRGLDISPPTRTVETVGLASEGAQLIDSGLSTEVFETILHPRAPSKRKLYALKWRVFISWCSDHQLDTVNDPVGTLLEFLQERFTAGLAHPL